ncbi:nucleotidyltransferase domain-containing protein [Pseudomonas sp. B21-053]|uniref:nucleotidyltransferase domain-containing protein n=1 Tax=Pseudomonas sp. B21-053 TaxID=2895493 RepID=UPI002231FC74|nr:nucleotidyltransferase domain-containing protein [Pseudomonas sp. B21-053]UZE12323.1 nucleotidyltransferase domain-containing protein [Pseudomonas sp. B21-053]
MLTKKKPVASFDKLNSRVRSLFKSPNKKVRSGAQLKLNFKNLTPEKYRAPLRNEVAEFITHVSNSLAYGDIYLFGGVLRDLALLGRGGFNSDIDLVVDGDWNGCAKILLAYGARKNKFGGYRLDISGWPIDIWSAKETWAIKQGLVEYKDISSLTNTTVLNWDAILMNWRTGEFICRENYLDELKERMMDIVLIDNPNPVGMMVRVLRHLCTKDAKSITPAVAEYLANCSNQYTFEEIQHSEFASYGSTVIEPAIYRFFEKLKQLEKLDMRTRFKTASEVLAQEGAALSFQQLEFKF